MSDEGDVDEVDITNDVNQNHEVDDEGHHEMESREQDRFLPVANIARLMKKVLPPNAKIAKDAKESIQECVSEFISFITSEASDKCQAEKRKTINGDDILWAMNTLGFEKYIDPLKTYLLKYRESVKGEKPEKVNKSAMKASANAKKERDRLDFLMQSKFSNPSSLSTPIMSYLNSSSYSSTAGSGMLSTISERNQFTPYDVNLLGGSMNIGNSSAVRSIRDQQLYLGSTKMEGGGGPPSMTNYMASVSSGGKLPSLPKRSPVVSSTLPSIGAAGIGGLLLPPPPMQQFSQPLLSLPPSQLQGSSQGLISSNNNSNNNNDSGGGGGGVNC